MIRRLLVANRGEIALRVFRAARELGIETAGVYPREDARALHVQRCDRAVEIEGTPGDPRSAYLSADAIVKAAREAGADAVHPGYGFLSENPDFAERIESEGLVFVGPTPEAMRALGVKTRARALMEGAGVPVVPGTVRPVASAQEAAASADSFGYPVALKAAYGGGGRGIRVVRSADGLQNAFEGASREARDAFGNGELYVEKYLEHVRHIEVQVVGDGRGRAVHYFERDCSMQRRNQKLIEEAPAPNLEPEHRARLLDDAVKAARAARYRSAGTVEFLVAGGRHYFLEVNARLQVEHPVTEAVTGADLVRTQLLLASGEDALPPQDEVVLRGHAIECRINAENPRENFLPSPGRILRYEPPSGPGIRVDGAADPGGEVSSFFDSLLAKVIAHGATRASAIARMRVALADFVVTGVYTTIPFHRFALASAPFASGVYSTATVGELGPVPPPAREEERTAAVAAALANVLRPRPSAAGRVPARDRSSRPPLRPPFPPTGGGWFYEL